MVAPSPTTLRITDGRQGWAESPTVRCRAFQLTVKEARAAPNVVKAMYLSLISLFDIVYYSCLLVFL